MYRTENARMAGRYRLSAQKKLSDGVTGNTTDFGSVESRFDS
jgi:hypothetical protein